MWSVALPASVMAFGAVLLVANVAVRRRERRRPEEVEPMSLPPSPALVTPSRLKAAPPPPPRAEPAARAGALAKAAGPAKVPEEAKPAKSAGPARAPEPVEEPDPAPAPRDTPAARRDLSPGQRERVERLAAAVRTEFDTLLTAERAKARLE